jgi:hypothetical protein
MKDYLDPKQNPFINLGDEETGNPRLPDEDGPGFNAEDFRIPLPDKDGLFPGEAKTEAAESSPALDLSKVESFLRVRGELSVYAGAECNVLLFKVKNGREGKIIVEEYPGEERPIEESDMHLILDSMARE